MNMDAHELNTWLILGTLFLLCLVGLGIGIPGGRPDFRGRPFNGGHPGGRMF